MTAEAQRIAIAKACGFTGIEHGNGIWVGIAPGSVSDLTFPLPDYLGDLNAMHSAIDAAIIPDVDLTMRFQNELAKVMDVESYHCETRFLWHATAAQRAEAFLRTIGKWTDN